VIKTAYSIFYDFEILRRAHHVARRCKRTKIPVAKFELNEIENISKLQNELKSHTYSVGGYHSFIVTDPKRREIQAIPYRDRIVQHILCDEILTPYFSRRVIYDNTACLFGKGQHFAARRFKTFLKSFWHAHRDDGYFLKCDILKYFPSLSHTVIKRQISAHIADKDIKNLFNSIIDSYQTPETFLKKYNIPTIERKFIPHVGWRMTQILRGVPIGNQTSQTIGMYYLDPVDRFVKETLRVKHYIRYMDDFILIHHDRDFLVGALEQIRKICRDELYVELNDKTQIIPMSRGVKFLGSHYYFTPRGKVVNRVSNRTRRKFKKRIKQINENCPKTISQKYAKSVLASYHGHFKHTSSRGAAAKIKQSLRVDINAPTPPIDIFADFD
jgi:hypothetical protein